MSDVERYIAKRKRQQAGFATEFESRYRAFKTHAVYNSGTKSRGVPGMVPSARPPTHPGMILLEEFLKPMKLSRSELARRMGVSVTHVSALIRGKRQVTLQTARLLSRALKTTPELWLNLQSSVREYRSRGQSRRGEMANARHRPTFEDCSASLALLAMLRRSKQNISRAKTRSLEEVFASLRKRIEAFNCDRVRYKTVVSRVGNDLGATLPAAVTRTHHIKNGDILYVISTDEGIMLIPVDPEIARWADSYAKADKQNRGVLSALSRAGRRRHR